MNPGSANMIMNGSPAAHLMTPDHRNHGFKAHPYQGGVGQGYPWAQANLTPPMPSPGDGKLSFSADHTLSMEGPVAAGIIEGLLREYEAQCNVVLALTSAQALINIPPVIEAFWRTASRHLGSALSSPAAWEDLAQADSALCLHLSRIGGEAGLEVLIHADVYLVEPCRAWVPTGLLGAKQRICSSWMAAVRAGSHSPHSVPPVSGTMTSPTSTSASSASASASSTSSISSLDMMMTTTPVSSAPPVSLGTQAFTMTQDQGMAHGTKGKGNGVGVFPDATQLMMMANSASAGPTNPAMASINHSTGGMGKSEQGSTPAPRPSDPTAQGLGIDQLEGWTEGGDGTIPFLDGFSCVF